MKKTATLREIREATNDEVKARIARLEEELFSSRMKRYTNQLENTMKIRHARREIALCKTVLSQRLSGKSGASGTSGAQPAAPAQE